MPSGGNLINVNQIIRIMIVNKDDSNPSSGRRGNKSIPLFEHNAVLSYTSLSDESENTFDLTKWC